VKVPTAVVDRVWMLMSSLQLANELTRSSGQNRNRKGLKCAFLVQDYEPGIERQIFALLARKTKWR
jgi:hypothetical protein